MAKEGTKLWNGAELRAWLERKDATDTDAARLFGVTVTTVGNWLDGVPAAPAARFAQYLDAMGIHPATVASMMGVTWSGRSRKAFRDQNAPAGLPVALPGMPVERFGWETAKEDGDE